MKKLLPLVALLWLTVAGYGQGVMNVRVRQMPKPGPVLYNASTIRNTTLYPLTTAGLNSFTAAASSGVFSLSVNCPCGEIAVIPAGTKPPLVAPCPGTCTNTPTWASMWYDYVGNLLTIRATGDDMKIRFENQDGTPIATNNPDNVQIDNVQFFGHATIGGFYQWQAYLDTKPKKLTIRRNSDNATYVKTFTPAQGANNVNLFTAGSGGGTGCDYTVAVNSPTVSCGASATLTATASGTAATGLLYSWASGQSTASAVVTAPSANGSYQYTVSVAKAGCPAPKTATSTVTVTGCSSGSGVAGKPPGYTYDYPTVTGISSWPAYNSKIINGHLIGDVARLENANILLEVRATYGGSIQIYDKATGRYLVCFFDHGRQSEGTFYAGPDNYSVGTNWPGIGYDPITAGDDGGHGSVIEAFALVTGNDGQQRIYVKTHLYSWPHGRPTNAVGARESRLLDCWTERWIGLTGRETDVKMRVTWNRTDLTNYQRAYQQEYTNNIVPGHTTTTRYYIGGNPYSNDGVKATSNKENSTTSFQQTSFRITEPWSSVEFTPGHYLFHNTDKMAELTTAVYVPEHPNEWGEESNAATYVASNNTLTVDPHSVWYHNYAFFVTDNFQEGRNWGNSRWRKYGDVPNFTFDVANGRNDWNVGKGLDQREPFTTNGWDCTFVPTQDGEPFPTAQRSYVVSPFVIHKASAIPNLYVRYKYGGSQTQMSLAFTKNGQREGSIDNSRPNEMNARFIEAINQGVQYFTFPVTNDNQWHTAVINTSSNSSWNGVIQQYKLSYIPQFVTPLTIPQEDFHLMYFGVNNPGL
jgi:hypothetical protein